VKLPYCSTKHWDFSTNACAVSFVHHYSPVKKNRGLLEQEKKNGYDAWFQSAAKKREILLFFEMEFENLRWWDDL
jgi:hypothetical protein